MNSREIMPLISIVVPVYGTEVYFNRCISSLLEQSYKNLEIIIVNDGSRGNIRELISTYDSDSRVVFVDNESNQGLFRARVCGAQKATGEYIAFVDSDDYVSHDFYRVMLDKALKEKADIVIGKTVWEKNDTRYVYNYHEACFNFERLADEEIKIAYFGQETQCYSWHTIWNKLYKKTLWDACMPEYESVSEHIIMTEDIYFSSVLFFNAKCVVHTNSEAYFYCSNENASTNSTGITYGKYEKNIHDIEFVFNKVGQYLREHQASENVLTGFSRGRSHYARMWKCLAENTFVDEELELALGLVDKFCTDLGSQKVQDDHFFESVQTPWNGGLEYIKSIINDDKYEYISFDVFDTLISRPFYKPTDIFKLMNSEFSKKLKNSISFEKIRKEGEELARKYYGNRYGFEDITLNEIYDFISKHYGIEKIICAEMMEYEIELEIKFCQARQSGKELFEYAKTIGKKVILISDMYLDADLIRRILVKSGIYGYERLFLSCQERKLKYNGGLFEKALSELAVGKDMLIHIGDTWHSDIEGSNLVGIKNIFFPKAIEVFENKIQGVSTNRCSSIGFSGCGDYRSRDKVLENLGYRCMVAMVANKYFDNPYRTFNSDTDFNMDPYFIGYYPVGMHMIGIAKWLKDVYDSCDYKHLVFLARDGYLPKWAFEEFVRADYGREKKIDVQYIQASRKAIMPILLKERINFYQLPIEYRAHTPMTLSEVLSFAVPENYLSEEYLIERLEGNGIIPDKAFETVEQLHQYLAFYFEYLYDEKKHKVAIEDIKHYYSTIPGKSLAFDMGYSGRIQSAICDAAEKEIDVAFIHEDYLTSVEMKNHCAFKIHNFYNYRPEISGLMREHIFSDTNGSCIGFAQKDGGVQEIFESANHIYPDAFVINTIQNGAVDFVQEFVHIFGKYAALLDYSNIDVSLPFEGFLRYPNVNDMHIFSASYFEDMVFGARKEINIEQFAMQNLALLGWPIIELPKEESTLPPINIEDEKITQLIHHSSQVKRGLVWILLDWSFFVEKLKINLKRIFSHSERE